MECKFCSYKHRCGKGDETDYSDVDAYGLLLSFDDYPEEKIAEYLDLRRS